MSDNSYQAANLRGFRASVNPRFEAGISDFMNGILDFSIHFNVVGLHRKVDWRNPKMKSLNSMPGYQYHTGADTGFFFGCLEPPPPPRLSAILFALAIITRMHNEKS